MIIAVNYADKKFRRAQKLNSRTAGQWGADRVIEYGPDDIDETFRRRNREILDTPRGGGYYLWKPYFYRKAYDELGEGDYLVYIDSGAVYINKIQYLIDCMEQEETPLSNLYFIRMDAEQIGKVFDKEEVDRIYLNFSDPWPKDRHAKRRLTSKEFLVRYDQILKVGGQVEFKTDNRLLFDFSLESVKEAGWNLKAFTYDLHYDPELMKGNIMTEYEERFSALGNPVHKLIADIEKN